MSLWRVWHQMLGNFASLDACFPGRLPTRLAASVLPKDRFRLESDPDDKDGQSLLFWYPVVTTTT